MKIALITGGGSGIGLACAKTLAENGYHTILTGRRGQALNDACNVIGHDKSSAIVCDITSEKDIDALLAKIEEQYGRLDVLLNNAGNNVPAAPIGDVPVANFKTVINVNLVGAFIMARGAFNLMRKQTPQGGRIINNGSISASKPRPGSTPYTASKHAMTGMTRTISLDGR